MSCTILLDSSSTMLNVGLAKDDVLIDKTSYYAWQRQSEYMVVEIDKILTKNNVAKEDISSLVVSVGPGSYTGIRIALTIAKIMAVALSIPIYPVSSLFIKKHCKKPTICLINARGKRSYFAVYNAGDNNILDCVITNEEVLSYIESHSDFAVCGDTKYLDKDGVEFEPFENMLEAKKVIEPVYDIDTIKPLYFKDEY